MPVNKDHTVNGLPFRNAFRFQELFSDLRAVVFGQVFYKLANRFHPVNFHFLLPYELPEGCIKFDSHKESPVLIDGKPLK